MSFDVEEYCRDRLAEIRTDISQYGRATVLLEPGDSAKGHVNEIASRLEELLQAAFKDSAFDIHVDGFRRISIEKRPK